MISNFFFLYDIYESLSINLIKDEDNFIINFEIEDKNNQELGLITFNINNFYV